MMKLKQLITFVLLITLFACSSSTDEKNEVESEKTETEKLELEENKKGEIEEESEGKGDKPVKKVVTWMKKSPTELAVSDVEDILKFKLEGKITGPTSPIDYIIKQKEGIAYILRHTNLYKIDLKKKDIIQHVDCKDFVDHEQFNVKAKVLRKLESTAIHVSENGLNVLLVLPQPYATGEAKEKTQLAVIQLNNELEKQGDVIRLENYYPYFNFPISMYVYPNKTIGLFDLLNTQTDLYKNGAWETNDQYLDIGNKGRIIPHSVKDRMKKIQYTKPSGKRMSYTFTKVPEFTNYEGSFCVNGRLFVYTKECLYDMEKAVYWEFGNMQNFKALLNGAHWIDQGTFKLVAY